LKLANTAFTDGEKYNEVNGLDCNSIAPLFLNIKPPLANPLEDGLIINP
jgi:hypothetical protein